MPKKIEEMTFAEFEAHAEKEGAKENGATDVTPHHVRNMIENGVEDDSRAFKGDEDDEDDEGEDTDEDVDEDGDDGERATEENPEDEDEVVVKVKKSKDTDDEDPLKGKSDDELNPEQRAQRQASRLRRKFRKEREAREAAEAALAAARSARRSDDAEPGTRTPATTKETVSDDAEPNPDDYEFKDIDTEYLRDVARHAGRKAFKEQHEAQQRAETEAQQREALKTTRQRFNETIARGASDFDDFEEVAIAKASDYQLSKDMFDLIVEDKKAGHKILYHLATNKSEAERIAGLTPAKQGIEFEKLKARFSPPTPEKSDAGSTGTGTGLKRLTHAATPLTRRTRGGATPKKQVGNMSFSEFEAHINAENAQRK